ncbi:acetyl-CoA hydrolase/transferase family protein [Viridibacillus sp. YIM B01967]|uniref:Acetyl-CoA hydrolase/transferase family protein n=1 Tax=Viridibacillus soli TaxID=2798301 RepID=A0ABS1H556_9BACL|nr:acetyl-CoA hydrolase/transferase family protein [Viridibacillus soli]MBK3494537.1 acetyl-CoA hydrolase/transferase family protein [Viridibacillus soli]
MTVKIEERLRHAELAKKVITAQEAAALVKDGMALGLSGFTRSGDAKAVPMALVERSKNEKFKVDVYTGASLGSDIDTIMSDAGIIGKRVPFQSDSAMRGHINKGDMYYIDQHLSITAEYLRQGAMKGVDIAIIEAVAITEDGLLIPTTSVGNSPIFVSTADKVIIELNLASYPALEGMHDIYVPGNQGERGPIPLLNASDRIGTIGIPLDLDKVAGIVITNQEDSESAIVPPDAETDQIASHLLDFLRNEIKEGRLTEELAPMQSGVGSVANAVLHGMLDSEFKDLEVYSEVLQDAVFDLIDAGKVKFASGCSTTLSQEKMDSVYHNLEKYKDKVVLRPQEISNHPELIRRMGLIAINTALELDIYGNVNSTHVSGTKMMNGIGGSGDFTRNSRVAIFVTKSYAKGGKISSVVPFVPHVDHTEHDVDVIVTEQGYADLRGLAPRERSAVIIENCAHPKFKDALNAYVEEASARGGQTPHVLEKAFEFHTNLAKYGQMLAPETEDVK